jgi:polar amino acid transport system substrate-binding protein
MRDGRKISKNPLTILLFLSVLVLIPAGLVHPQEKPLNVAIEMLAPCVMQSKGAYTGFEIELWEEISKELGLESAYYETDMEGIFTDLTKGSAQVGFSCITINHEREKLVDFSHHTLDSGLRILVLNKKKFSLIETLKSLFSPLVLKSLTYLGLFILICGNIFWWVEKGRKFISNRYFPGIFQAFWYVLVTMTTVGYGDIVPRKWVGRVMAFLVMLIGIGFFAWAIAQLSSVITLQRLHSDITGPQDLRNRVVATVEGTTSIPTLKNLGAVVVPVKLIDKAYKKLLQGEVEAVVFDAPAILYYVQNEGAGKVQVIGPLFDIQYYGFLFPEGSQLREPVNRAFLKLRTNGTYDRLYNKWFGSN